MSNTVIKVESLSKQYRLGNVGLGSFGADINRWYQTRVRGKEDPYLKIGEENNREVKGLSEYVWALRDINFEVKQGEVLGIIGRNGAGKSTLLKILSRTTAPTTGQIKIKGRVASLLEVGTGFHPELTGRENIFLNGAILGMTKNEIKSKFDEIVDFAGVDRYVDTPVKRYSSGMYVRLAFAVAAHLEPEILIVDEVLAVGDIEFQKKAIGKMKDVSQGQGRTVLFVSHNMTAIKNLCNSSLLLVNGKMQNKGETSKIIDEYLIVNKIDSPQIKEYQSFEEAPGNDLIRMKRMAAVPIIEKDTDIITVNNPVNIEFEFWNKIKDKSINLSLHLFNGKGECIFNATTESKYITEDIYKGICHIPAPFLNDDFYTVSIMVVAESSYAICSFENVVSFEIVEDRRASGWHGKRPGFVRPALNFTFQKWI